MRGLFAVAAAVLLSGASSALGHVGAQSAGISATGGSNLFSSIGAETQVSGQPVWPAAIDFSLLATLPQTLVINFPDRASATLTRMRSETRNGGAYLWTGNGGGCTAVLNVTPTNVLGTISCLTGNYFVRGMGPSLQLTRFVGSSTAVANFEGPPVAFKAPQYTEPMAVQPSGTQVDTAVDVLVLYSDAVRQYFDPSGGSAVTRQTAQFAIDNVQMAMTNSTSSHAPFLPYVRLAGVSEVSRTATGNLVADQLWLDSDPEPLNLRNFWAADVMLYLTLDGESGVFGRSNTPGDGLPVPGPGFAPSAHSSLVARCAVMALGTDCSQPFVFLHEFGHLFGANHNPENNDNPTPLTSYAFANWKAVGSDQPGYGNRTLMSYYVGGVGGCADVISHCVTVLYYSNAQVMDGSFLTGTPDARENARVISASASATANYRLDISRIFYDGFQY